MLEPISVRQLIPTFHVKDVQKAAEWYRDQLGWEIEFIAAPDYGGVKFGGQTLHLAQWQRAGELQPSQAYAMLDSGVDAYAAQLISRGVQPHQMPRDHAYGMRELNVRDLDGNFLHIGQPLPA